MSFTNLPTGWTDLPVSAPGRAADVVDLFMGEHDRVLGSLLVVRCDRDHRIAGNPIMVAGIPWRCPDAERETYLRNLMVALPAAGVLLAVGSGPGLPLALAQTWRRTAAEQASAAGKTLVGFLNVSLTNVRQVGPDVSPR